MSIPHTPDEIEELMYYLKGFMEVQCPCEFAEPFLIKAGIQQFNKDKEFDSNEYISVYLNWKKQKNKEQSGEKDDTT